MSANIVGTYRRHGAQQCLGQPSPARSLRGPEQEEFEAPRTGFFPSIKATLNHILIVDWFYVDGLEGGWLGPKAWVDRTPCATVADLQREQAAVDRRLIAVCDALTEQSLGGMCASIATRASRPSVATGCSCTSSSIRSIIAARPTPCWPARASSRPSSTSSISIAEAPLRAPEFAALGWTEETVWGGER